MSYESTLKRLPNFLRYVNKVYSFSQTIDSMQGNVNAEVSPQTIFMSVFPVHASSPGFASAVGVGCQIRQDT